MLAWLSVALPAAAQGNAGAPERWAELADTIFRNYGPDNGVPIAPVMAFAEDGDGFLWVGTQAGLARWDGYHFHIYRSDPSDPGALRNDFIWCLQKDSQGRLWVGTNGGGVSRYDRSSDRFVTFDIASADQGSVPVRSLADDGSGGVWVGSDRGLDHLGPDGKSLGHRRHDAADPASLPGDQVLALLRDRVGRLWVGTGSGLARQDKEGSGFALVPLDKAGAERPTIRSLLEAGGGRIWVGTRAHGAYVLDDTGSVKAVDEAAISDLSKLTVVSLAEVAPGVVWLATDGKGIIAVDTAGGRVKRIRHDSARPSSLPHDFLFSLYRDRSGLVWAGTFSGLGAHDPTQQAILTVFGESDQAQRLTGGDILSVLSARDGNIWATFLDGGADILDPVGMKLVALRPDPAHPQTGLPSDRIRAVAQAGDEDVYLGTYHGLYRVSPKGERVTHVPVSPQTPDPAIISLASDTSGLWVGTRGEGLWHIDVNSGKSRRVAADGLTNHWITAILPTEDGQLWVGSYQGLYLLDLSSDRIRQVLPDPQGSQSLSVGLTSSLLKDHRGRLWAATLGGGIVVIDGADVDGRWRMRRIGQAEGLPELNIATLLEDESGVIWAGIGTGLLSRIDPDTLTVQTLQRADGVAVRGIGMNAGARTPQGELLFGGDALTILRPDRIRPWTWRPPVVVTDLRIGGGALPPQSVDGDGPKAPLEITPEGNSLSVEFAALDYSAPDRNRYAYRLEGFDADWVATDSTRRLASYTNLPPGRYTLHLRGSNRDGQWTDATLDIPVRVLPAWYQTILFRAAMGILLILGVWGLVRSRTAYLRRRQVVLEQQVADRTAELGRSLREVAEGRAKVTNLLDTSGQGYLSFGSDLIVEPDYSRACVSMLDGAPEGRAADEVLFGDDAGKAETFRKAISGALTSEDSFKRDLLFSLLPATILRHGRVLKSEYRRLDNDHVMVVLTDVTEEHRLSRRIESERLRLSMIVAAVSESRDFFDAVEAYRKFLREDLAPLLSLRASPSSIRQELYRQVHTFKGTFAHFSFNATPKMLHELEGRLSELERQGGDLTIGAIIEATLSDDYNWALESDLSVLRDALGEEFLAQGKGVFLPMSQARELRAVAERLLSGEPLDLGSAAIRALFAGFRNLDKVSLADALEIYDRVVSQVAVRLNKQVEPLAIDGGEDLWVAPETYGPFLRSLIHIFRNAVVHGIEEPEDRAGSGKDPAGRIECAIRRQGSGFTLTIADDGAGLDLDMLRERAASLDLLSGAEAAELSDREAAELIFVDRISVQDRADEWAGRGVGLAAVRTETLALGGRVEVASTVGQGTRFTFYFR